MEQSMIIFSSICVFIFLFCIICMSFVINHQKILELLYKVNESDKRLVENLNNKYHLIIRAIKIIERELKIDSKIFEQLKGINKSAINNFDLDNLLTESKNKVFEINDDDSSLIKVKSFASILKDLETIDIDLVSLRTFYNKYTSVYNNLINKFPYNLISKIKHYKIKGIYSGEEIEKDEF